MPTYEYLCQTCSHRFEVWQKMIDEPLQACPECGNHIRRVLYPAGIVFKGSGFYKTDHRAAAPAAASDEGKKAETVGAAGTAGASAGASSETQGQKSSEKSGESKPAASSTGKASSKSGSGSSSGSSSGSGDSKVAAGTKA